jgi:hypothetical protein
VTPGTDATPKRGSTWAEDKADRPIWTEADWSDWIADGWVTDRDALVRQFGEDLAHFALLRLLIAQQRGQYIHDSLAWCRTVAQHQKWREERQARRYVSRSFWGSTETEQVPKELWDLVTPERRVIARDLLDRAHPSLVAWHLGEETTISPRMRSHRRAQLRALADEEARPRPPETNVYRK